MRILSAYKDIYLEFLKDTQPVTEPQIRAFFKKYDQYKDTHTFESIAEALARKEEVYYLDLSKKELTVLPIEITSFPNLLALDLSNNFIKNFAGLAQLDRLEVIFIENAELTEAPPELAQLSKLTSINLNNNRIFSIPDAYFDLPVLTGFNLDHNNIEHVPTSIQHAKSLTGFYLDENKLDTFPLPTCYAPALKILTLNGNRIHQIPRTISRLKGLVYLSLSECGIKSIPIEFCELEKLETLKISSHKLTKIPEEIGNLKQLKNLSIKGKVLKRIPPSITDLPRLERLQIKGEQLVELPDTFDRLENLQHLTIEGSPETNIPNSISGLRKLKELSLFNFSIGSLPDLSNCTLLEALYLGSNKISHIPPAMGSLAHLQSLILWNNDLKEIPAELGNLANLITLNLGKNQLQSLPVELAKLRKLSSFRFNSNPMNEMREIRGMGIDEVFDYLKRLQGGHYHFNWEMPKALTIIIQQYLDFFPEFAKKVIGKEINLNIQRTPIGLKISIDLEGDLSIEKINELLRVYIKCAKESIEGIFNGYPKDMQDELFKLRFEHQIDHLKQQLRFLEFENKVLREHITDYKHLLSHINELFEFRGLSIPPVLIEKVNNEEEEEDKLDKAALKNLVANNKLPKVLSILETNVPETRTKLYNMVIGIQARLNKLKLDVNIGRIPRHEEVLEESAIRYIVLGIIDEL